MLDEDLIFAIQRVLDIGSHIVAAESWGLPGSYREVIEKLGDHGVLPREFARELAPMAGFRNILQRGHVELDLEQLHRNACRFDDFSRFAECVVGYLER
ncbi:MAG: type VII toxin-antitoxin system HepT family RNase toxin [Thermoleophilia bacterium]